MATAKKGKTKKGSKGKKKRGNSGFFTKFILILLVLAMIAAAVFFTLGNFSIDEIKFNNEKKEAKTEAVIKKEENKNVAKPKEEAKVKVENKTEIKKEDTNVKKEFKELKTLEGCWISSEQGAFITIDQYGYRIDFSNVDASEPLTGNYYIDNNLITFVSDGAECKGEEGTYRITFYKKNISLSCKNDDCTSRRNILETDWEWIEI